MLPARIGIGLKLREVGYLAMAFATQPCEDVRVHARWAPLLFKGSYWNVAEDELDVVAAYYRLQARNIQQCRVGYL